jgi:uncharacterized protein YndB with AHSA1/START domain
MGETQITAEPGIPQFQMTREFDAPRELLFRAYTDPELLVQWLGPRRLSMKIDRYDARHGGEWRYVHSDDDGNDYAFRGVFHGTPSVDGIVQTWEFEGAPGHVHLETAAFEEHDGGTRLVLTAVYPSVESRDAELAHGMESGARESLDRLDELIGQLQPVS